MPESKNKFKMGSWCAYGSGVSLYEIAVGSSSDGADIKDWTSVGLVTSAQLNALNLSVGRQRARVSG
jgi:hypothetical protein